MATIPSIASAVAGARFTATLYNGIKAFCDFLIDTPHCSLTQTSATSIPTSGVLTLLPWDTETDDSDSMHSTSTNPSRVIFVTGGRYEIQVFVTLASVPSASYSVNIRLNSAGSSVGGTSLRTFPSNITNRQFPIPTITRVFAASDYIEVFVLQTAGGAILTDVGGGLYSIGLQARMIGLT